MGYSKRGVVCIGLLLAFRFTLCYLCLGVSYCHLGCVATVVYDYLYLDRGKIYFNGRCFCWLCKF